jgi:hypothetical protein
MTELPPPNTRRWVAHRKAAVSGGMITLEEACLRYPLSQEEFFAWQRAFETHGLHGLHATRAQHYRTAHSSRPTSPASSTTTSTQHPLDPEVKEQAKPELTPLLPAGANLSRANCPPVSSF